MTMNKTLCVLGLAGAVIAASPLIAAASAKDHVLTLVCSDNTGGYNYWVNLTRRTVTQGFPWASGAKGYGVFPATITPATIIWSESDGGRTNIDRGTGRMTFYQGGQGPRYFQCSKGSAPMPATRF